MSEMSFCGKKEDVHLNWMDLLKGIGICLVIIGHCHYLFLPIKKYIYGFHMPLFFIINGYLFNQNYSFSTFLVKKTKRYLIPYFVLCFINFFIVFCISIITKDIFTLKKYLFGIFYSIGKTEYMPNCSPLWFLTALFFTSLIFYFSRQVKEKYYFFLMILFAIIGSLLSKFCLFRLIWNLDVSFMGVFFCYIGYYIRKYKIFEKMATYPLLIFVFFAIGFIFIFLNKSIVDFDTNFYGNPLLMIFGAVFTCLPLFTIAKLIHSCKFLEFLGKNTLFVLGFDYLFESFFLVGFSKFHVENRFVSFALEITVIFIIVFLSIFIWNVLKKKLNILRYLGF